MMKRKEVMELQKMAAIESFIGCNILEFTEEKIGLDWKIFLEKREITEYIHHLINDSLYFNSQLNGRSQEDVIAELIYSRCIEHRLLQKWNGHACLSGRDKDQLITKDCSYFPDIKETNTNYYYEVVSTYNGQFILNSTLFVRESKMNYLINFARSHSIFIVAVDVLSKKYCFIPIKNDINKMNYIKKGALTGYTIDISNVDWFSLEEPDFIVD